VVVSYTEAEYPVPSCGDWEVLQGGLGAISKEHTETGQQIIKKLATEKGLAKIKALADEKVDGVKLQTRLRIFKDRTFPFFRIISHPAPEHSIVLDIRDTTRYHLHISFWPK